MIILVAKKLVNGRWADAGEIYRLDQIIMLADGLTYKVTNINGSKITLEQEE